MKKKTVIAISGVKNSGKTTLIENLVPKLKKKGIKTAVIKHDGHDFEADIPGTDSDRVRRAGAIGTAVFSASKSFVVRNASDEIMANNTQNVDLSEGKNAEAFKKDMVEKLVEQFQEADLILLEGFKNSDYPKLELIRKGNSKCSVCLGNNLLAIVSDFEPEHPESIPLLDLNHIEQIIEFLLNVINVSEEGDMRGSVELIDRKEDIGNECKIPENFQQDSQKVSMVILAGGKSSRMGRDKADLLLGDKTFLETQIEKGHALGISDIIISGYKGNCCQQLPIVADRVLEKGPLGGLEACFRRVKNELVLVLCVDVPLVPVQELKNMIELAKKTENKAVVLRHGSRTEPLMGVFAADLAEDMVEEIDHGRGRMFAVLEKRGYQVYETALPDYLFCNVNDPEAYQSLWQKRDENTLRECTQRISVWEITDGKEPQKTERTILKEHEITVYVNGVRYKKMSCTNTELEELVLGNLLTSGVIYAGQEVEQIQRSKSSDEIYVQLRQKVPGEILNEVSEMENEGPLSGTTGKKSAFFWKTEWIWKLEDAFEKEMVLHDATNSAHAAFLMVNGEILYQCEDMGRHNALDKAIGYAVKNKIDLRQAILFTSGRVPVDMAEKAIRAKVPMLVSRKSPTVEGVEKAKINGLLLVCNVRKHSMRIYSEINLL